MIALFFDTETTGFKREDFTPEIVQIAAILQDTATLRPIHEISVIVQPRGHIPDETTAIHGISTELARTYGLEQLEAESLFYHLAEHADTIVAHNIEFDMQMLKDNWPETHRLIEAEKQTYCTMRELTPIMKLPKTGENHYHDDKYPEWKAPKLQEAYQHFYGKPFEGAHDAMVDTRALRDVYFAMHRSSISAGE